MTWAALALALLKVINNIMNLVEREQLERAGYDKAIAATAAEVLRKTATGRAILEKVNALTDDEVDAALRDLEPK